MKEINIRPKVGGTLHAWQSNSRKVFIAVQGPNSGGWFSKHQCLELAEWLIAMTKRLEDDPS